MMARQWWMFAAALLVLGVTAKNVNLVIPQTMKHSPRSTFGSGVDGWKAFDRKVSTSWTVGMSENLHLYLGYDFERPTLVKKYKIRLPPRAGPKVIPRAWRVRGVGLDSSGSFRIVVFDEVSDAVYVKREYTGKIKNPMAIIGYEFYFLADSTPGDGWNKISVGEISLIGPKSQLDQPGFPNNGVYPCPAAMELIRTPPGVSNYFGYGLIDNRTFGVPTTTPMNEFVRRLFDIDDRNWTPYHEPIYFEPFGPGNVRQKEAVVFGFKFDTPTEVLMSSMAGSFQGTWDFKLQGSFCQPDCDELGSTGWLDLSVQANALGGTAGYVMMPIEQPDSYKAYRIVAKPVKKAAGTRWLYLIFRDINLFKCRG